MRVIDYKCYKCDKVFNILFRDNADVTKTAICECGNKVKEYWVKNSFNIIIDDWTPETNNGQRDIEHFEKKQVKDGKYVSRQTMYKEDRMKQGIPMNLGEV